MIVDKISFTIYNLFISISYKLSPFSEIFVTNLVTKLSYAKMI